MKIGAGWAWMVSSSMQRKELSVRGIIHAVQTLMEIENVWLVDSKRVWYGLIWHIYPGVVRSLI